MIPKRNKIELIGFGLGVKQFDRVILNMYLSGMCGKEIAEDINSKSSYYKITGKGIEDLIKRLGVKDDIKYMRTQSEAYLNAIARGRKAYKTKENKYKRKGITLKKRYEVLQRDGFKCVLCGGNYCLEVDHIKPISQGGENTPNNLQSLCWYCNHGKAQFEK